MEIFAYILIAMLAIFVIVGGYILVTTVIELHTLGNRVEDSLIASGWAGFEKIDFDEVAKRIYLDSEEGRNIYLNENEARNQVIEFIKENLKLDGAFYPREDSYIPHKAHPIIIDEVTVYNPDDLPSTCSCGTYLSITTIHIDVSIPVDIKWLGFRYIKKHVDVDINSFYLN